MAALPLINKLQSHRRGYTRLSQKVTFKQATASKSAKQRSTKISVQIDAVCACAYTDGLSNESLGQLLNIVTRPNQLDQSSIGNLIRNLYPASRVPDEIIIKVVGSLGHGRVKPSYSAQAALLKWLIMVYDVLENQKVLSQLYSLLFNLLDTSAIRRTTAMSRAVAHHTTMELTRQGGSEPTLIGLLRVFKDYYPDVIVGEVNSGRASVFTHPNPEWRQRLGEIQDLYVQRTKDGLVNGQKTFKVTRQVSSRGRNASVLPEVYTSRAHETSVTLEEIENVHDFIQKLERIEPPNQLVAVINDPLLQKFLQLRSSESHSKRVDNWLMAFFEDQLQSTSNAGERQILDMLDSVLGYTRHTKTLPVSCLSYLKSMIPTWNGVAGRRVVLALLAYTPIVSWDGLYSSTFQPLEEALLDDGTNNSQLALLAFYKTVLDQWTVFLLSQTQPHPTRSATTTIINLTNHASALALTIIQNNNTISAHSSVLSFYETIASLITHPLLKPTVRITIPPAEIVYSLLFTTSLSTVSRLCAILALHKKAFELAMTPKATHASESEAQSYPKDYINHFNGYLMDVCNCFWRSRAFNTTDPNALGCLLPPSTIQTLEKYISSLDTNLSLPNLFSVSYSPVFSRLAIKYVRELEDSSEEQIERRHAGPVTQTSLKQLEKDGGLSLPWADYRLGVLEYLEGQGVDGVGELMFNTMKHLMTAREKAKA
ncbi:related to Mis6 domain protein [Rhynchosporium agropyri]|uniref:Related to Mis6 domain protein n=1 Tax=Rhynchosporium agropyri TaxID=914238 RepID=A0A1E1K4P2_9HELO|nr:related to Mis6 domain protein [Rhynchosporium agropyri]